MPEFTLEEVLAVLIRLLSPFQIERSKFRCMSASHCSGTMGDDVDVGGKILGMPVWLRLGTMSEERRRSGALKACALPVWLIRQLCRSTLDAHAHTQGKVKGHVMLCSGWIRGVQI